MSDFWAVQTSMDRLSHLEELATSWGGTICVAVHVKTRAEIIPVGEKLKSLYDRIEEQHHCRLNLQMVIEEGFENETDALTASYPVHSSFPIPISLPRYFHPQECIKFQCGTGSSGVALDVSNI